MNNVLVIGGDKRFLYLSRILEEKGCNVRNFGIDAKKEEYDMESFENEVKRADVIILPIPYTKDGITVNTPLCDECLYLSKIYTNVKDDTLIFGGVVGEKFLPPENLNFYDYAKRDDFAYLNAVPTAEGAIEAVMKHMPGTILGSNALVTGFGKCAKVLSLTLKSLGANVTVCARRSSDLSFARALGMNGVRICKMKNHLGTADVIFNTVPHIIFKEEELKLIRKECPLADIASLPGGADKALAQREGVNYLFLPGIPGKYSPSKGAQIILETIENISEEMGKEGKLWNLSEKG